MGIEYRFVMRQGFFEAAMMADADGKWRAVA
jgi:hypothetical protein